MFLFNEDIKPLWDVTSLWTIFLSLVGAMPEIAAFAAFIWTCIRIYETDTVQNIFRKRRKKNVRLQKE
jgi:hypothetical protein